MVCCHFRPKKAKKRSPITIIPGPPMRQTALKIGAVAGLGIAALVTVLNALNNDGKSSRSYNCNSSILDSSSESESRLTPPPSPPRAIQNYRPSCDTEVLAVVRERDRQLRLGILQMATEPDTEEDLVLHIILLRVFANSFPYVHLHEWEVVPGRSQFGKGDLVFTDGKDSYLIVECKYINHDSGKTARARRRNKRRKVEYQAKMYAENFLRHRQPGAKSISFVPITNEEDRSIRTAEKRIQTLDL